MEEFVGSDSVDEILTELQENLQKYKFMESSKRQSRKTYVMKIPEIKKALDVVSLLAEQGVRQCLFEEMTLIHCPNKEKGESTPATFELSDNLFANASIDPSSTVCLWLGVCSINLLFTNQFQHSATFFTYSPFKFYRLT